MTESDIMHENGRYWVARSPHAYTVFVTGVTHSVSDSAYDKTEDGLSIAKARCDYLARTGDADKRFASLSRPHWSL